MEGEAEYGFWHVLVRDVCYAQIPRAARAARHGGGRLDRAQGGRAGRGPRRCAGPPLPAGAGARRAAGQTRNAEELEAAAIRYLALAGERRFALDVDAPRHNLAQALSSLPPATRRARLLERWAHAAQQQGRLQEARAALEEAIGLYREQGQPSPPGGR